MTVRYDSTTSSAGRTQTRGEGDAELSRGVWTRKIALEEERLTMPTPALLGVLGDTHMSASRARRSIDAAIDLFQRARVDRILHTGDAGHASVIHDLETVAPVSIVRGNADPLDLIEALPDRVWIDIGGRTVLLMHGHHGKTAVKTARDVASEEIDLIVFGHSHQPLIERQGKTILFNPGSPTERRWNPHFGIGLIRVSDAAIEPELILFDDPRHLANVTP
jgi:putative phosphoesterase